MTGLVVLLVALAASALLGWWWTRRNGRFASTDVPAPAREVLGSAEIGEPLGERATLVQFSSAFCAPCRATRVVLAEVAGMVDGVTAVEIDAESHLDLVRRLDVMRTPTTFVLDAGGAIVTRASGLPSRDQVLTAVSQAIPESRSTN